MPELLEDAIVEAIRIRAKWKNDDYICGGHILNGMSDSLFDVYTNVESAKELWDSLESKYMAEDSSSKKFLDFKHTLKHGKDDLSLVQLGSHLRIEESLRVQDSDKDKGKEVGGPFDRRGCVVRLVTSKGIVVVVKRTTQMLVVRKKGLRTNPKTKVDATAWWIDSGATTHVCKDRCWFKTFKPVKDGSVLYMGDEHFAPVHGKGSVALEFSSGKTVTLFNVFYVPKLHKNLVSGPVLNNCGYKQVYESDKYILSKCGVFVGFGYYNTDMFMLNLNKVPDDSDSVYTSYSSTVVNTSLWHARLGHVHYKRMLEMSKDELILAIDENYDKCTTSKDKAIDKFRIYKTEVVLQQNNLIKNLRTDRGGEYYDLVFCQSVGVIHETTAPYTPQQNGVAERKNRGLKEMVNFMLSYSSLSEGSGEKPCIDCIFVGYAKHSKAYRFYVIEPNDSVSINSIIESRDAIFDGNRFYLIPRPKDIIPNSDKSQRDDHSDDVPSEISKHRKGKKVRKAESYGSDFQLYLVEGSKDQVGSQYSYCSSIEKDPRTYNEAMQSRDAALLLLALAAIHNLVIHQMDVKTTFLNGDLDEEMYMKQPKGFVMPGNEHKVCKLVKSLYRLKQAPKQWHQKFDEVVLSSGLPVFLVDNIGAILWASKKQTCITGSTMESEFLALAAAGKKAEWLRNLIPEISIWPKPITPIYIRCDSAPTMARAYSQIYNGKSRHLGVRHSMVRELIRNGVISIEFVRTQHNSADHLTKGLARDLVYKSVIGMGLKSI
nr:hypothetical protein [Tanacetum cinerariifolium]